MLAIDDIIKQPDDLFTGALEAVRRLHDARLEAGVAAMTLADREKTKTTRTTWAAKGLASPRRRSQGFPRPLSATSCRPPFSAISRTWGWHSRLFGTR